jgi:hypothetical protein
MLILDFHTGKMTKLALELGDVAYVVGPGAALGLGGAGLGYLIDMLAGTNRKWTKILGLLGLVGGAGAGGLGRYMYKHFTPEKQLLRLMDQTNKPASEQLLAQRYPSETALKEAQKRYQNLKPVELFDMLVWGITSNGGPWYYSPNPDTYQIALRLLENHPNQKVVRLARGVAIRGHVLALYRERIKPELQVPITNEFQAYVESVRQQLAREQPNWEAVTQQLNKVATMLRTGGHGDIADLFEDPFGALEQEQQ